MCVGRWWVVVVGVEGEETGKYNGVKITGAAGRMEEKGREGVERKKE